MLNVGNRKQLFIDHRFIDTARDVELTVNPPVKLPGPVLRGEHQWESFSIGWSCVLEDDGLFKLWYAASDSDQWAGGRWHLCYATSEDGRTWEKPELGLVEYDGSKRNNIVLADCKLPYIFVDPNGGRPTASRWWSRCGAPASASAPPRTGSRGTCRTGSCAP